MHIAIPLIHTTTDTGADSLQSEMEQHLDAHPQLRFMASLIDYARKQQIWTRDDELKALDMLAIFDNLKQRPDLRALIVQITTGLFNDLAQQTSFAFQRTLMEAASNVKTLPQEKILDVLRPEVLAPEVLACYTDTGSLWELFQDKANDSEPDHAEEIKELLALAIKTALDIDLVSAWEIRMALRHSWQHFIPAVLHEKVDLQRLEYERKHPEKPFTSAHVLQVIPPNVFVEHIPLANLLPAMQRIEESLKADALPDENEVEEQEAGDTRTESDSPKG